MKLPNRSGAIEKRSFTAINDFTEDFDRPHEFENLKDMYEILAGSGIRKKVPVYLKFLVYQIKKIFSDHRFKGYKTKDWKFAPVDSDINMDF